MAQSSSNSPTGSRRSPDEVRRAIVPAADGLFAERGYEGTTLREVARAARVSNSVLFRHFASKPALLRAVVVEPFALFVDDVLPLLESVADGRQAPQFVAELRAHLEPRRGSLRALLSALQSPDGDGVMAEVGGLLAPMFDRVRTSPRGAAGGDADAMDLRLRLVIGAVATVVVLDEWFTPDTDTTGTALIGMIGQLASRYPDRDGDAALAVPAPAGGPSPSAARSEPAPLPAGRRRRPTVEVRRELLRSAEASFVTRGFAATTYADIARGARTSESALHRHFGSKQNLLAEAVLEPIAAALSELPDWWASGGPGPPAGERLRLVARLYDTLRSHRPLVRTLMSVATDPAHRDIGKLVAMRLAGIFVQARGWAARPERERQDDLRLRAAVALAIAASSLDDWFLCGASGVNRDRIVGELARVVSDRDRNQAPVSPNGTRHVKES
ncbi:TetR/AcrR family transcriptional regulator [Mycobacterium sp. SMC-8]|uniref:TetR/AcrR family transcriptional regulator n=1 Tax=Mycobacterium sp. SMC-8 TaxID=2857060 RepID=UPI0021B19BCF|nr:TetR/AcrR family transcriptional regulator [Mycobacterium sp. SMC-8]UXA11494.1 TetR/AcrR family transcriptional regulator [Mycobacterium sp. SMC-8]